MSTLLLAVSPLILLGNPLLQFLGASLILVVGLYLNSKYLDKVDFSEYGLVLEKATFFQVIIGIAIGFTAVISILLLGEVTKILIVSESASVLNASSVSFALKMFLVAFLEETFYRGYLFTTFSQRLLSAASTNKSGLLIALVLSSLFFGLAHLGTENANVLSIAFLTLNGMVWCIPFIISKNLGLSIGMHTAWNFFQTQVGFTMSGNKSNYAYFSIENNAADWLTGGAYGPEAGALGLVGLMVMLCLSLAYLRVMSYR